MAKSAAFEMKGRSHNPVKYNSSSVSVLNLGLIIWDKGNFRNISNGEEYSGLNNSDLRSKC